MDIKQQVRSYVMDNFIMGGDVGQIANDTSFLAAGVIDSTGVLELIAFLEKTYLIKVHDEEMIPENLDSLNNIERFVRGKLAGASAA